MTREEIQEQLKRNDLSLSELSKLMKELQKLQEGEQEDIISTSQSSNKKAAPTWTLKIKNYPDFVIERTTPKTVSQLVFMVSCDQYYIKFVKGEEGTIKELNSETYTNFTSGMEKIILGDDFWIYSILPGKKFYDTIMRLLSATNYPTGDETTEDKTTKDLIKHHCCIQLLSRDGNFCELGYIREELRAYAQFPLLYKEFFHSPKAKNLIVLESPNIKTLLDTFGLEKTRDFLVNVEQSLIDCKSYSDFNYYHPMNSIFGMHGFKREYHEGVIPNMPMEYEKFKEYVLYRSVQMGFASNMKHFFNLWTDYLTMSFEIDQKIKQKYPPYLQTSHDIVKYKYSSRKKEIDAEKFKNQCALTKALEWANKDFVFIAPKSVDDFYDEASQQANCLASYVDKFTNGEDFIIFMRKKATPEESYITIEVRGNIIAQAYLAGNKTPSREDDKEILEWAKNKNLCYYTD